MNREIKYRQFINGKMVYSGFERCGSFVMPNVNISIYPIMQYTGIKDRNGTGLIEVYEGDIISENGMLKGNIYEIDKRETDIVVPQLGTKAWEATYKEIVARGYDYSE